MDGWKVLARIAGLAWLWLAWLTMFPISLRVAMAFRAGEVLAGLGLLVRPSKRVVNLSMAYAVVEFVVAIPAITNPAIANYPVLLPVLAVVFFTLATWGAANKAGIVGEPPKVKAKAPPPDLI